MHTIGMFGIDQIDPRQLEEADRLARRAIGVWIGGCIVPFLIGLFASGSGELLLGFMLVISIIQLAVAAAAIVVSIRLALRALALNPAAVLAKAAMLLNIFAAIAIVLYAGAFLWVASLR